VSNAAHPAPAPQTPSLGRIVHVPMDPTMNNGADVAAAVITRVWSPTTVNLRVLADGESLLWRTSSTYADDLDAIDADDPTRLNRWTWPPRV
jgi:hypothetical protein